MSLLVKIEKKLSNHILKPKKNETVQELNEDITVECAFTDASQNQNTQSKRYLLLRNTIPAKVKLSSNETIVVAKQLKVTKPCSDERSSCLLENSASTTIEPIDIDSGNVTKDSYLSHPRTTTLNFNDSLKKETQHVDVTWELTSSDLHKFAPCLKRSSKCYGASDLKLTNSKFF